MNKYLDLDSFFPNSYGDWKSPPKFFELEYALILPFGMCFSVFILLFVIFIGEYLNFTNYFNSASIVLGFSLGFLISGIFGFYLIFLLCHRKVNKKEMDWALSVYENLRMNEPYINMTKQGLKRYIEKSHLTNLNQEKK
jgi:hypothetical protein